MSKIHKRQCQMVARKFLRHIGMPCSGKGVKLKTLITNGLRHITASQEIIDLPMYSLERKSFMSNYIKNNVSKNTTVRAKKVKRYGQDTVHLSSKAVTIYKAGDNVKQTSQEFLKSWEWTTLRMEAIKLYGRTCMCCGAKHGVDGVVIHVDHIKPRSKYPELSLELKNLQILCHDCNKGKGAWDETDWRTDEQKSMVGAL